MVLKDADTPRRIPLSVVESAANTFTTIKIQLPNSKGETVFDLDKVELRYLTGNPAAADDFGGYQVQIQRDTGTTPTDMIDIDDDRVLYNGDIVFASGTEAADINFQYLQEQGKDHIGYAEYIANDSVWLCVKGAAMAAAQTMKGWLIGSIEALNQKQIMALLQSQLN